MEVLDSCRVFWKQGSNARTSLKQRAVIAEATIEKAIDPGKVRREMQKGKKKEKALQIACEVRKMKDPSSSSEQKNFYCIWIITPHVVGSD